MAVSTTQKSSLINMDSIIARIKAAENKRAKDELIESNYRCNICKDTGLVLKNAETNTYTDCECRNKEKINNLWKKFGVNIDDIKLIRDYETYNDETKRAKAKAVDYLKNFDETKNNWFCLMGTPGGGKTHLVKAMGKALIDKNISVVYMAYIEAIRQLKSFANDEEYYIRVVAKYTEAPVLIIDDLFKDKVSKGSLTGRLTEADLKHVYTIINYRYQNNLPTIISTECTPQLLCELDEALAGRILEKATKKFGQVFTGGSNYRIREWS